MCVCVCKKAEYFRFRYIATGNSFRSLAFSFRLGEATVREIIYSTCEAMWQNMQPVVMPSPDEKMWIEIEKSFCNKWNFPNLIGAIDGKHVIIQAPPHSGSNFFCYKKTFSTVLLALVDANYRFIAIDVGAYGKNSDGGIFSNSNLGKSLKYNKLQIPPGKQLPGSEENLPYVIIGDEAFPLSTYLMRPYSGDQASVDEEKKVFNYRLSRARNVSENAFGILVRKFRFLERKLCMSHEHIKTVLLAACCLHNFLRDDTYHWTENDLNISISDMKGLQNIQKIGENSSISTVQIRDRFKRCFNSAAGSLEGQLRKVREGKIFT